MELGGTFASIKSLLVNLFSAILSYSSVNMHKCKTSQLSFKKLTEHDRRLINFKRPRNDLISIFMHKMVYLCMLNDWPKFEY